MLFFRSISFNRRRRPHRLYQTHGACGIAALTALAACWPLATAAEKREKAPPAERPANTRLTLAAALARVLQHSPELAAFAYDQRAAEARILQAGLRPNPEAALTVENAAATRGRGPLAGTETTLELRQLLELGGKRTARLQAAQADRTLIRFDYETKRLAVLSATAQSFYEVLGAQQRVALHEEIVKLAEEFAPAIRQRLEAGKASEVEMTRNDLTIATAKIGLEQARRDLAAARRKLASAWAAKQPDFEEVLGDLERVPAEKPFAAYLAPLAAHPAVARWESEAAKRRAALAKAKAEAKPDVTVSGGARWLNGPDEAALVGSISVPLPFRNQNEGHIREAQVLMEKVRVEKSAAEAALVAEAGAAFEAMAKARAELRLLSESVLPSARTSLDAVLVGYSAGKLTQLDVLEARRTIAEARTQHLQALVALHQAAAQLDALTQSLPAKK